MLSIKNEINIINYSGEEPSTEELSQETVEVQTKEQQIAETVFSNKNTILKIRLPKLNSFKAKTTKKADLEKGESIMKFVDKTLKRANEKFDKGDFKSASKNYGKVVNSEAHLYLEITSYAEVIKSLYQSQMNLWEKETDPKAGHEKFKDAYTSLKEYQKWKPNKDLVTNFSIRAFEHISRMIDKNPALSVVYYKALFTIYCEQLKDNPNFDQLVDDLLHNITVCILEQEDIQQNSSDQLVRTMLEILDHPLVGDERKKHYNDWLESDWEKVKNEMIDPIDNPLPNEMEVAEILAFESLKRRNSNDQADSFKRTKLF